MNLKPTDFGILTGPDRVEKASANCSANLYNEKSFMPHQKQ
jgi:hypothetical protein